MTDRECYVIRRAFVTPLGLALLLLAGLLAVSVAHGQPAAKLVFLAAFALPLTVLFAASAFRRLEIDATGITAVRLHRRRRIDFAQVTALDVVQVRSRVFLTLSAGDDEFLIVSNAYARFPALLQKLVTALPAGVVTEEARRLVAAPPVRHADLVMVWFVVVALSYVLIAQFNG